MVPRRMLATIAVLSVPALAAPASVLAQTQSSNVLAGVLAPGHAEVSVGFDGDFYPRTSWPLRVDVQLRPRGSQRALTTVWVRFKAPRARCAHSFARDRGTSVGSLRRVVRAPGFRRFRTRRPHTWQRPGLVRFCVWLGRSRQTRIRPVVQDVEFFGGLFGAALSPDRFATGFRAAVASAVPFRDIAERRSRDPSCRSAPEIFDFVPPEYRPPLFLADGANNYVGCRDATDLRTYTLVAEPSGQPVVRPQGSLSYTLADAHHHVIRHLGACVFERDLDNRRVADAVAYIRAVGCRPGRMIAIPRTPNAFRIPSPGAVYAYYVHGGQAILVPRNTAVDMIVNR